MPQIVRGGQIWESIFGRFYSKFLTGSKVCGLALMFGFRERKMQNSDEDAYSMHDAVYRACRKEKSKWILMCR